MPKLQLETIFGGALAAILAASLASPATADPLPSYAVGTTDETIHGTVATVNGPDAIAVRDARGFIDNVTLHRGTIINPTGLMLEPGQTVTILGRAEGTTFSANEIDTPYHTVAIAPFNSGYGYGYPYGHYAYPFYGAGFGFHHGFGFGIGI